MIDFSKVDRMEIPEGTVLEMMDKDGQTIYTRLKERYVSFGDSIAAGHAINDDWAEDYGTKSQYGVDGNYNPTVIVPGCYTDLLAKKIEQKEGMLNAYSLSFAQSGLRIASLIALLKTPAVMEALSKASMVTICIGANEVLQPALNNLASYFKEGAPSLGLIEKGELPDGQECIDDAIARISGDGETDSLNGLLKLLHAINPTAKYAFTTIYNPMKYLWLEPSTEESGYTDGFFGPMLSAVTVDLGIVDLSATVRGLLYKAVNNYGGTILDILFDRFNRVAKWTEDQLIKLNNVLRDAIRNCDFLDVKLTDTKSLFDTYPDRTVGGSGITHYNDLVNIEFTKGFTIAALNWGVLWEGLAGKDFAQNCIDAWNSGSLNGFLNGIMNAFVNGNNGIIDKLIMPDIDPHPESGGHELLYHTFADAFKLENVLEHYTLSFENTKGGFGSMSSIELPHIKGVVPYTVLPRNGFLPQVSVFKFLGWNTSKDGGAGTRYQPGDSIPVAGDMTLYAEWDEMCEVTIDADYNEACRSYMTAYPHTGVKENYRIYTSSDGKSWKLIQNNYLDKIQDAPRTISVKYGDYLRVCVRPKNKATATWPIVTTSGWFPTLSSDSESGNVVYIKDKHWDQTLDLYFTKVNVMVTLNSLGAESFWTGLTKENSISEMFVNGKNVKSSSETGFEDEIYVDLQVLSNDIKVTFIYFQTELETTATKLDLNAPVDLSSFGLGKGYIGAQAECKVWDCYISCNNSEYKGCGNTGN